MLPAIGIPLCLDARGRWRPGRDYLYLDEAYARAIDDAGGLPVLLPIQTPESAPELIARVDALLLPGGDDFAPPEPYPAEVRFDLAEPRQIEFDRALLRAALLACKPVLGICYGMQLLALEAGGSLHHHLPVDVPAALEHGAGAMGTAEHRVAVDDGSQLGAWLPAGEYAINSRHHQAVRDPGALRVVARAPDGVIEAIESPGSPAATSRAPQFGVQWHPEALEGPAGDGLLRGFVELAASGSS